MPFDGVCCKNKKSRLATKCLAHTYTVACFKFGLLISWWNCLIKLSGENVYYVGSIDSCRGQIVLFFLRIKIPFDRGPFTAARLLNESIERPSRWCARKCALRVNVAICAVLAGSLFVDRLGSLHAHFRRNRPIRPDAAENCRLPWWQQRPIYPALMVSGSSGHCYRSPKQNAEPFSPAYYFHIFAVVFWRCVQPYSRRRTNSGRNGANREQNWNCELARNVGIAKSR